MQQNLYYIVRRDAKLSNQDIKERLDEYVNMEDEEYNYFIRRIHDVTGQCVDYVRNVIPIANTNEESITYLAEIFNRGGIKAKVVNKKLVIKFPKKEQDRQLKAVYKKVKNKYFMRIPENLQCAFQDVRSELLYDSVMFIDVTSFDWLDDINWPYGLTCADVEFYVVAVQDYHY